MEPVRTCVTCRSRAPQAELVRLVAADRVLRLDVAHRLPGRGCYIHRSCAAATTLRALARGLRTGLDGDHVAEVLATLSAD